MGAAIAEQRRIRARLAASETRYRLIAENTTDLVSLVRPDGTFVYISPSVTRLGYRPADLVGRNGLEVMHPDDVERCVRLILRGKLSTRGTGRGRTCVASSG